MAVGVSMRIKAWEGGRLGWESTEAEFLDVIRTKV